MIEHLKGQIVAQGIAQEEEYDKVASLARLELEQDKEPDGMPAYVIFGQRSLTPKPRSSTSGVFRY